MTFPQFYAAAVADAVQVSTANTNRDGSTGTYATLSTAAANQSKKIEKVIVCAPGTTTAGVVRLFLSDTAGANFRLIKEQLVTAITPSATIECFRAEITLGFVMPPGCVLKASTHNAETFNLTAIGGTY